MESTVLRLPARREMSPSRLLDGPLDDLLLELEIELHLSSVTDPGFIGALVQRRDGSLILSMPPGRPRLERDAAVRMILAKGFGLEASPAPSLLEASRT
ncbi:hypothetical protein ACWD3J_14080 [Streptomyces sp. NPDC002755]